MKNLIIGLVILINTMCACNFNTSNAASNSDFLIITEIIYSDYEYFDNKNQSIPRVFYTSSLANDHVIDSIKQGTTFFFLLKKNKISKIYIGSKNEIWYVYDKNESLFNLTEKLIGFSTISPLENSKIFYYKSTQMEKLDNNWYKIVIKKSLID